ncbi:MAG: TetR/AcrR family transcriptional regulator [Selenomonas ruminantium]|nr:TetR/AcrR family transcriptional regulator [Selenomonas ruminantium]
MDRRQKKTRTAIFTAFNELLTEKSYHQITVQDIIDRANVGRTTFYDHFETKDALLKEMCMSLFDHVFSDMLHPESTHDFSLSDGSSRTVITHMIYHLRDSKKNILGILGCESGELFLQFFRQYLKDIFSPYLPVSGGEKIPKDFLLNHISGSFVNMIEWWIKGGTRETPEQLATYFEMVTQPVLTRAE